MFIGQRSSPSLLGATVSARANRRRSLCANCLKSSTQTLASTTGASRNAGPARRTVGQQQGRVQADAPVEPKALALASPEAPNDFGASKLCSRSSAAVAEGQISRWPQSKAGRTLNSAGASGARRRSGSSSSSARGVAGAIDRLDRQLELELAGAEDAPSELTGRCESRYAPRLTARLTAAAPDKCRPRHCATRPSVGGNTSHTTRRPATSGRGAQVATDVVRARLRPICGRRKRHKSGVCVMSRHDNNNHNAARPPPPPKLELDRGGQFIFLPHERRSERRIGLVVRVSLRGCGRKRRLWSTRRLPAGKQTAERFMGRVGQVHERRSGKRHAIAESSARRLSAHKRSRP